MHTYHHLSDDIVNIAGTLNHMPILWILMDNGYEILMTRSYLNNLRIIIQREKKSNPDKH